MKHKKTLKMLLWVLAVLVALAAGYVAYVLIDYHRLPDNLPVEVTGAAEEGRVPVGLPISVMSYNVGFCAYTPDYGFFMDGGRESRAESPTSVREVMAGIGQVIRDNDPDIAVLQEVDQAATRSWHIDQRQELARAQEGRDVAYTVNYDSPYLFWPLLEPHGRSLAGMLTTSRWRITSALRRSLPVEQSLYKLLDLDRCYTAHRMETTNGRELVFYALHLSAYTRDGTVSDRQAAMLAEDMQREYEKGNYVIAAGDFNKDLAGSSGEIFGHDISGLGWAQPFPCKVLENRDIRLVVPLDEDHPVPTCRNADGPYTEDQAVLIVDGFLVSPNVAVMDSTVVDTQFRWSDHNPVMCHVALVP